MKKLAPLRVRCAPVLILATCVALCVTGCTRAAQPPGSIPSTEATGTPASAVKNADSVDVAAAKETALEYVGALTSRDASAAAGLMTSYRRAETRAKGWKTDNRQWKTAQVKAVTHPGHYLGDERTFAELYAEHFGHPPYKLVVVNVAYGLGPGVPPGDTDFVVTKDHAGAPWLVHDFGGALHPDSQQPGTP